MSRYQKQLIQDTLETSIQETHTLEVNRGTPTLEMNILKINLEATNSNAAYSRNIYSRNTYSRSLFKEHLL